METRDTIRSRRNVRTYDGRPISGQSLELILEAGRRAPSASNRQPWDFVVVTDRQKLEQMSKMWRNARHVAGSAATVVLVLPEPENDRYRLMDQYDLGQATMAMTLAAADLGIGSAHAAVGDQEACRALFSIPGGRYCPYLLALGYPGDRPLAPIERPDRRALDEIVHWSRW